MCQLECRIQPQPGPGLHQLCQAAIEELFKLISNSDRLEQHKQKLSPAVKSMRIFRACESFHHYLILGKFKWSKTATTDKINLDQVARGSPANGNVLNGKLSSSASHMNQKVEEN